MTDTELLDLMGRNVSRFEAEKNVLYNQLLAMDDFIQQGFKKNAVHRHFKTKREMREAMAKDFNPYNTFSFGKKAPERL